MESYRSDGAQSRVEQRVDPAQACQNDDSGSFGVKVQVQGIYGHPYVVLTGEEKNVSSPEYPDVFLMENQQQGLLSYMSGSATQTPWPDVRSLRNKTTTTTQLMNYHKTPEILRPYDPRNSSLNVQYHSLYSVCGGGVCFSSPPSPVMVKPGGIPVPRVNQERDVTVENVPCHTLSVPDPSEYTELYSTSTERREWPRVGRVHYRSRMRLKDERRSSSAESRLSVMDPFPRIADTEMEVECSTASRKQKEKSRSPEREAQATPDLLKVQQDIPDQPDEKTAKQMMFNYLRDGSSDGEDVIRQRVDMMFEKIHTLKSRATDTLKENSVKKLKRLQEELGRSKQEQLTLRHKLTDMEKELQTSLDQLLQAKRARDQCRADMMDVQQQLSDVHEELDSTKNTEAGERDRLLQDLRELREEFRVLHEVHEKQDDVLQHRERELMTLRRALEGEISAHITDVETLKEIHQQEVQKLLKATEEAKESLAVLGQKVLEVAAEKAVNQTHISELIRTTAELQKKIRASEKHITTLQDIIQQNHNQKNLLEEHVQQLRMEKQNLEVELIKVRQQEENMCETNRALMRHVEDTQMSVVVLDSERETQRLQNEQCVLEDKLSSCEFDLNEATMKTQELQKRIQQLEENKHTQENKHLKVMEVRVCELEKCLTEEHNSSHLLMKTLERGREQMEQVRSDLLQERAARQDLECDKISLERQNKELRCHTYQLEASQRMGQDVQLSKLQLRIYELEEKLLREEKEKSDLQQHNRKLERKMKEMMLLQDDERLSLQDQKDQLLLRLKSLKRLLDEAEDEIQRLETSKKKLQRDVDEQQEMNEQLQTQLSALRMDIRRDKRPNTLQTTDEDERASSSD